MNEEKMKAVGFYKYLPIEEKESLLDLYIDIPEAKGKDILVKVEAIAINPVDYKVRSPKEKLEETPKVLGWDIAGIVQSVGDECKLYKPGDKVYYAGDLLRPGGNSEYHLVDERIVGNKPKSLSFSEAAALPLTAITAYESLFERLKISKNQNENSGKKILIINSSGGVGSIAIQMAKIAGLEVIGTASRTETVKWAKDMGADYTINHYWDFKEQLQKANIQNIQYILCLHSTEQYWSSMADIIAPQGSICSIVETMENLNLQLLKSKSVTFSWETMFTRSMYNTDDIMEQHKLLNEVSKWVDENKIKPTLSKCISPINAENIKKAHKWLETEKTIGKVVVEGF